MPLSFGDVTVREVWMISSQGADPQKIMSLPEKERLTAVHWSLDGKQLGYVHVRQISGGLHRL